MVKLVSSAVSLVSLLFKSKRLEAPKYTPITKHQHDVSATAVGEWEKELMEDPKVLRTSGAPHVTKADGRRTDLL